MSKGKGKEREDRLSNEDDSSSGSTLFVSNLAYNTTTQTLEAFFSDIAPVRNCFIVTRKDPITGEVNSKGVGYVSFALKEDAISVLKSSETKKLMVDGRAVRLEQATKKDPSHIRKERAAAAKENPVPEERLQVPSSSRPSVVRDKAASRTLVIIVSHPSPEASQKTLWKKVRKYPGAQSVAFPVVGLPDGDATSQVAHAVFETAIQAQQAAGKLHAHIWKGGQLSAVVKKKADAFGQKGKGGADARLIVRNLPKDITEDDLRQVFITHVPVHSVHLPAPKSNGKQRFAFIQMYTKEDAEKALSRVNGSRVVSGASKSKDRPTADQNSTPAPDPVKKEENVDAPMSLAARIAPLEAINHDDEGEVVEEKPPVDSGGASGKKLEGRIVAVDWALSKAQWETTRSKIEGDESVKEEEADAASSDEDETMADRDGKDESAEEEEEVTSGEEDRDASEESDTEEDDRSHLPATSEGATLFVRNLPFEATDEDLGNLFKTFGPMRYARVTMDHETERSRGTGFVCFWKRETADEVLQEAQKMSVSLGIPNNATKGAPQAFSLLTPDPSSSLTSKLVLMGRTLSVTLAVTRDEAGHLRDAAEKQREKKDTRNLYLLREGVIFADTPAATLISPGELKRRLQAYEDRRASLRTNPSLYISRTRLSVRNLPTWVTDRGLRKLGIHAVAAFNREVAAGEREDVTRDEYNVDALMTVEETEGVEGVVSSEPSKKQKKQKKFFSSSSSYNKAIVKQAKIARSADRLDPLSPHAGVGKSNGFGFLEMERHSDALKVLRWANNRPDVTGQLMLGWWKDELKEIVARAKAVEPQVKVQQEKVSGGGGKGAEKHHAVTDEDAKKAKLQLWERTLKEMDGGEKVKAKPLLVEFSIENRHVVKMRADKLKRSQAPKIDVSQPDVLGVKRRRREVDNDETDGIKKRVKVEGERKPTRPNKTRGKPPSRANKRPKH
ncbi:RNA recognition motif-containing protein [Tulasnella sp. JGI-2019a]|nr:RNA recognition motif-containing protein [Tulasnella sp. JGI-2019a]